MPQTTLSDIAHLWNRAAFGISADDADARTGWTLDQVIAELVDTPAVPMPRPAVMDNWRVRDPFRAWQLADAWIEWMAVTPTPAAEKLAWFWHNHMPISVAKVPYSVPVLAYLNGIQTRAQGPFRDLLGATVLSAGMLSYLDNILNLKGKLNENMARELLELFTVGPGSFTEADVVGVARSLTGWVVQLSTLQPVYSAFHHDAGSKTVLGATGAFDADDIFDLVTTGPLRQVTARNIAGRLWSAWAYPNPTPALVNAIAAQAVADGMTGAAFARAVLRQPEFFSNAAKTRPRTPLESVIAALRVSQSTGAETVAATVLLSAGHLPLLPPNVGGWPAPRELWTFASWSAVASLHVSAAMAAAQRSAGPVPITLHLPTVDAARVLLRHAGVVAPAAATVNAIASSIAKVRLGILTSPWEPAVGHLGATLSPDFARS